MELLFSKAEHNKEDLEHKIKKHKRGTSMGEMLSKKKMM
jgi:hypothetical protein